MAGRPARRKRQIAELLTEGHEPAWWPASSASRRRGSANYGTELEAGWQAFQGGATPVATVPV